MCNRNSYKRYNDRDNKIYINGKDDDLPIRPIISNIETSIYHLSKYLTQILRALIESEYTIKDCMTVSFDVVSICTNVPLEETIHTILRRIYERKEITIDTDISKDEMRELLYLRENVHFTFNNKTFIQNDSIATALNAMLANIFMVEIEAALIPNLSSDLCFGRRFVDGSIFCRKGSIKFMLNTLNNFHENMKFTFEKKKRWKNPIFRCFTSS